MLYTVQHHNVHYYEREPIINQRLQTVWLIQLRSNDNENNDKNNTGMSSKQKHTLNENAFIKTIDHCQSVLPKSQQQESFFVFKEPLYSTNNYKKTHTDHIILLFLINSLYTNLKMLLVVKNVQHEAGSLVMNNFMH